MKCECGGKVVTLDTRQIDLGIWRRRRCDTCHVEFTTLEQRCETIRAPYMAKRDKALAQGEIVARPVPKVTRPVTRPTKRAVMKRQPAIEAPRPPVDRAEPSALDRVEDLRAEREAARQYGWD